MQSFALLKNAPTTVPKVHHAAPQIQGKHHNFNLRCQWGLQCMQLSVSSALECLFKFGLASLILIYQAVHSLLQISTMMEDMECLRNDQLLIQPTGFLPAQAMWPCMACITTLFEIMYRTDFAYNSLCNSCAFLSPGLSMQEL